MREAGAPPGRVLGEAWRPRSVVASASGIAREHALSDDWIGGADYVGGDAGIPERLGPQRPTRCRVG